MKHITNIALATSFVAILVFTGCGQNSEITPLETNIKTPESNETITTPSDSQTADLQKPVLTGPTESALSKDGKKSNVVFSWTGNAEHYDLMVRNPGDEKVSYVKANIKTTTSTDSFLPNKNAYTWWIRAYKSDDSPENFVDSDFGQFSVYQQSNGNVYTNTITSILPAELISPAEVKMDSSTNVILTFTWTGNAKKYDVMIKKPNDSDFKAVAMDLTSSNYEMEMNGSALGTYDWKIRSYDDMGNYKDSAVRKFSFGPH